MLRISWELQDWLNHCDRYVVRSVGMAIFFAAVHQARNGY